MSKNLLNNLKEIPNLFMPGARLGEKLQKISEIKTQLEGYSFSHKAIVFEGISMGLASQCLVLNSSQKWMEFYSAYQDLYFMHMQIGWGWACAKHDKKISEASPIKDPLALTTMTDGMGYYFALYKFKKTVLMQILPGNLENEFSKGFDSGVGRRLWYHYSGDKNQILNTINQFPTARQSKLWEGVGIACAYVGGFNYNTIESISALNHITNKYFLKGVSLGTLGKIRAREIKPKDLETIKQLLIKNNQIIYLKALQERNFSLL